MSNPILDFNNFGDKLYKMFPESYRNDDSKQEYALKRFLQSVGEGYAVVIKDTNDNLDLVDPTKTPKENLYKLYKQYGIEMSRGISETYLRSFLNDIGYVWQEKGSLGVISFVATSITGGGVFIFPERTETGVTLYLTVFLENARDMEVFPTIEQFTRIVENFTPFYCDVVAELIKDFVEEISIAYVEETANEATEVDKEENSQVDLVAPTGIDMYLNDSTGVLNTARLNVPQFYDIIKSGNTIVMIVYHTPDGAFFDIADFIKKAEENSNLSYIESIENKAVENTLTENQSITLISPVMGMFTNNSSCVLNQEVLHIPQVYDKIYSGSTLTRTIFHTPEGDIG